VALSLLQSYQRFLAPAIAPLFYNLCIIAAALFLIPFFGISALAVGVVVGSFLYLAAQIPALINRGLVYSFVINIVHPGVREIGRLMLPRTMALAVVQVNFVVDTILASRLAEGSITALNFAFLLLMFPLALFGYSIAASAFPTLAEAAALGYTSRLKDTLTSSLSVILFVTLPASVGMVVLRRPIVNLLFQYGKFDQASTDLTASILLFFSVGLCAHAVLEIVTRTFYATHDTRTPLLAAVVAIAVNIVLSLLLISPLGVGGLALANSLATFLEVSLLLGAIRKRLAGIGGRLLASSAVKMLISAGVMGAALFGLLRLTNSYIGLEATRQGLILQVGAACLLGGLIYVGLTYLLGCREARQVGEWLRGS